MLLLHDLASVLIAVKHLRRDFRRRRLLELRPDRRPQQNQLGEKV